MKHKKAISWENLSENVITAKEIERLVLQNHPISLNLLKVDQATGLPTTTIGNIQIVPVKGHSYKVMNCLDNSSGIPLNAKPYKYLSCAVRRAIKEYKTALRSHKWKLLTK